MAISKIPSAGLDSGAVGVSNLSATGTPSASTFLRGDNTWADPGGIGVGQTWQTVTGSRALNTTYTNTTGKPIQIMVSLSSNVVNTLFTATIGGQAITFSRNATPTNTLGYATLSAIIPDGATYLFSGGSVNQWLELR